MRAAAAWHDWQATKIARFGDNMREVAVTEGDKVEAQIRFGDAVNGYGARRPRRNSWQVTDAEVDRLCAEYASSYTLMQGLEKGGARAPVAPRRGAHRAGLARLPQGWRLPGLHHTFEDLYGLEQLPGLAVAAADGRRLRLRRRRRLEDAALVRAMKVMASGLKGGTSFMEDYTYHLDPAGRRCWARTCWRFARRSPSGKPSCEMHPLGIGGKDDPVRLVFDAHAGDASTHRSSTWATASA